MRRNLGPKWASCFIWTVTVIVVICCIWRASSRRRALPHLTNQSFVDPQIRVLQENLNDLRAVSSELRGLARQLNWTWQYGEPAEQRRRLRRHRERLFSAHWPKEGILHHRKEDTIFVSIASYRDQQCQPTVADMYAKALRPTSLFIGIVEQNLPSDDFSCIPPNYLESSCQLNQFCPTDNIQIRRIHPKDAKGPTFGRYLGMLMYRGEKYYMMIDSHNRFVTHWDRVVIEMYRGLIRDGTRKPVLSHYPEPWWNPEDQGASTNAPLDKRQTVAWLCKGKFLSMGFVKLDGIIIGASEKPRPQPWAAAGFLFADAQMALEVPFDPYLDFIFDGEEILYSIRLWTHGWDMFSPNTNILFHYYYRAKAPKFWGLLPKDMSQRQSAAQRRIQYFLQAFKKGTTELLVPKTTDERAVIIEKEKYGLGKERPLDSWYALAGANRTTYTVDKVLC